jgi:hypothetical protein
MLGSFGNRRSYSILRDTRRRSFCRRAVGSGEGQPEPRRRPASRLLVTQHACAADTEPMQSGRYDSLRAWGLRTLKPETMLRLSLAGMTLDLLIAASTLAPGAPLVPQWPQFVLFPLIFVVHFSSVLRLAPAGGRLRWRDLVAGLSPVAGLGFGVLFVAAWLVLMSSITSIGGQPTMSGGHYYLNDHGSLIPVSKAAYEHGLVLQQRIFTLGPAIFFALGALVHYPRRNVGDNSLANV